MRYIDEFRSKKLAQKISSQIKHIMPARPINIMEVCGTHTQNFLRFGLDKLLPQNLRLIAGPGCPVCVSPQEYIDQAIYLAGDKNNIILTFGDMLRIPGLKSSLEKERARGGNIRVVYSPAQALSVAQASPKKKIIFLAVGFETTAPTIALSILSAKKENLKNLFFLMSLKTIPAAMDFLLRDKRININGFLCPGHVSAIIGTKPYAFICRKHKISCCVAGFEPLDILEGIYFILRQIKENKARVDNQYIRIVATAGNLKAKQIMHEVFMPVASFWRGLGTIAQSGLKIRKEFSSFDAEIFLPKPFAIGHRPLASKCRCGDVLKGLIFPADCPLFRRACKPDYPLGPCMVSHEGACNAYYRYKK